MWNTNPSAVPPLSALALANVTDLIFGSDDVAAGKGVCRPGHDKRPDRARQIKRARAIGRAGVAGEQLTVQQTRPTDTLPTSPKVPAAPPTEIVTPVTFPVALRDLRAGTLADACPLPAIVKSELKSPETNGLVFDALWPFTVIEPTLGASIVPSRSPWPSGCQTERRR